MGDMSFDVEQEEKEKILIIDDTPDNLRLLSTILGEQGYEVRKALNGNLALKACKRVLPDLILLDINMPDMNGYEVCKALKADPKTCDIPIIFISALDDTLDKVKAFESGGKDYITKPFQEIEILAKVKQQLQLSCCQRQLREHQIYLLEAVKIKEKLKADLELIEAKKHNLIKIIPDSIFWINQVGTCLDYHLTHHRSFLKHKFTTSVHHEHFIGKNITEFLSENFEIWLRPFIEQTFLSHDIKIGEYAHPLNDQHQYNYEVRGIQSRENQVLLLIRDISK